MQSPKDIIRHYSITPRKSMGQCFLVDEGIIHKIAAFTDVRENDVVVEIGAGIGVLTEQLAKTAARVVAVELDERLVRVLTDRLSKYKNVEIHAGNILRFDFRSLFQKENRPLKIVGNIPYNISSPLLFYLLSFRDVINCFVLMMQKELVDRLTALPGNKTYGVPSVIFQMFADMENVLSIPASCFHPRPKVESSIIRGAFHHQPRYTLNDENYFIRLVRDAFAQRRKTLLNNLKHSKLTEGIEESWLREVLEKSGIDGQRRGETLSLREFAALGNIMMENKKVI